MRIWLDDDLEHRLMPADYDVWVHTAPDAIAKIEEGISRGEEVHISLDHDLGPDAGEGIDVAKWIERAAHEGLCPRISWDIHSANPVGRKNMEAALQSAERFWAKRQEKEKMASKKVTSQFVLDIVLPKDFKLDGRRGPSDAEANALYSLWKESQPGQDNFSVPHEHRQHINGWKANGLVEGFSGSLRLTDKGRKMIIEMVTNEPNAFEKNAKAPRYSEVKAKKKEASKSRLTRSSNAKKPSYNLKRIRDARNGNA